MNALRHLITASTAFALSGLLALGLPAQGDAAKAPKRADKLKKALSSMATLQSLEFKTSNKSIAQLLDISVDTVKVYNKRFHTKLDISSQAELFSLFLEAIALVPFDADIDPLTHYLEITSKPSR